MESKLETLHMTVAYDAFDDMLRNRQLLGMIMTVDNSS